MRHKKKIQWPPSDNPQMIAVLRVYKEGRLTAAAVNLVRNTYLRTSNEKFVEIARNIELKMEVIPEPEN